MPRDTPSGLTGQLPATTHRVAAAASVHGLAVTSSAQADSTSELLRFL